VHLVKTVGCVKYVHQIHIAMANQDFIVHQTKYLQLEANSIQTVDVDPGIMVQMARDVINVYSIIFVKVVCMQPHAIRITNHQLEATLHQIVFAGLAHMFQKMEAVKIVVQEGCLVMVIRRHVPTRQRITKISQLQLKINTQHPLLSMEILESHHPIQLIVRQAR